MLMVPKKTICFFLLVTCIFACGKAEEPLEPEPEEPMVLEYGTVSGTVTDAGTGNPIPGVLVTLFGKAILTGIDGVYTFQEVLYGDAHALVAEDMHYKPHNQTVALKQERLTVDIALTPLKDPVLEIQEFFDHFSDLLESVDMENIQAIQDHFSETYVAADDDATVFGVASGIIPENYEDVDPAVTQLFMEYTFLEFLFKDVEMDVTHAKKAAVTLRLDVNARKELEEDLREIKADCKFEFRREGPDWKIVYWQLLAIDIRL
jgi:hypothetical protein